MRIFIRKLLDNIVDPFDVPPWDCNCLNKNSIIDRYVLGDVAKYPQKNGDKTYHEQRIAYFLTVLQRDPIWMDVGIPALDYYPNDVIEDGWHRICAAMILHRKTIFARIGGDVEYAKEMFGVQSYVAKNY